MRLALVAALTAAAACAHAQSLSGVLPGGGVSTGSVVVSTNIVEDIVGTSFAVTAGEGTTLTCTVWPCPVHLSAIFTTASGISDPLHEVWYEWTFGDSAAASVNIAGRSMSLNEGISPLAGHVYESTSFPSTCGADDCSVHTVTLTPTIESGGAQVTESATLTVHEISPDALYAGTETTCYHDGSIGSGCPAGAADGGNVASSLNTALAACLAAAPQRCLFEGGVTFTGGGSQTYGAGKVLFSSYGAGQATLEFNFTSTTPIKINASTNGLVFHNLAINFPGTETAPFIDSATTSDVCTDVLFSNITFGTGANRPHLVIDCGADNANAPNEGSQVYFWRLAVTDAGHGANLPVFGLNVNQGFIIGSELTAKSGAEHIVRMYQGGNFVWDANYFHHLQDTKNALSLRNNPRDDGYPAGQNFAVTRNAFAVGNDTLGTGPWNSVALAYCSSNNADGDPLRMEDFWVLRNAFYNADPGATRFSLSRFTATAASGFGTSTFSWTGYCRDVTLAQNYCGLTAQNATASNTQRCFDTFSTVTGIRLRGNAGVMLTGSRTAATYLSDASTPDVVENNALYSVRSGDDIENGTTESSDNKVVTSDPFNVAAGDPASNPPDWDDLDITTGSAVLDVGTLDHLNTDAKGQARPVSTTDAGVFEKQ